MKDDTRNWRRQKKIETENKILLIGVLGSEKNREKGKIYIEKQNSNSNSESESESDSDSKYNSRVLSFSQLLLESVYFYVNLVLRK